MTLTYFKLLLFPPHWVIGFVIQKSNIRNYLFVRIMQPFALCMYLFFLIRKKILIDFVEWYLSFKSVSKIFFLFSPLQKSKKSSNQLFSAYLDISPPHIMKEKNIQNCKESFLLLQNVYLLQKKKKT